MILVGVALIAVGGLFTSCDINVKRGDPDPEKISTSYVERQNLTMRTLATSAGGLILGLVLIGGLLRLGVICAMKGKWVLFVLGWARRRYEALEIAEAKRRFSRKPFPRWGGSPWRTGVHDPTVESDPRDADLGKMG